MREDLDSHDQHPDTRQGCDREQFLPEPQVRAPHSQKRNDAEFDDEIHIAAHIAVYVLSTPAPAATNVNNGNTAAATI